MRRLWLLAVVAALALSGGSSPIRFLHPRASVVLVGPPGADVPIQCRVENHPDNRWFAIAWSGPGCAGSWGKSMDGEAESAIQPIQPIMARVHEGECVFVAAAFDGDGKERARAEFTVRACGGEVECVPAGR